MPREITEEEAQLLRDLAPIMPVLKELTRGDRAGKAIAALDRMGTVERASLVVEFAGMVADYSPELGGLAKLLRALSVIWSFALKTWPAILVGIGAFYMLEDWARAFFLSKVGSIE